jgi:hypothetical protein
MSKPKGDYEVGYRKPPTKSQFKPGVSGNPKGRKKGTLNLKTDLEQELSERIRIREGDQDKTVSKQRAMLKALMSKSLKGDARAVSILVMLIGKFFVEELSEVQTDLASSDLEIIDDFLKRRTAAGGGQSSPEVKKVENNE